MPPIVEARLYYYIYTYKLLGRRRLISLRDKDTEL
jgi:hypothetical protein